MMKTIAKTGFYTFAYSYIGFFFLDIIRPGFVSFHFSVHLFLVLAILFGIATCILYRDEQMADSKWGELFFFLVTGFMLAGLIWREGVVFGDFRFLLAIAPIILAVLSWFLTDVSKDYDE